MFWNVYLGNGFSLDISESLFHISGLGLNLCNLIKHYCEAYMVWYLLCEKSRQKML